MNQAFDSGWPAIDWEASLEGNGDVPLSGLRKMDRLLHYRSREVLK